MNMSCIKDCDCGECEMLSECHILLVDDRNEFNEMRYDVKGFKCNYQIKYDFDTFGLKHGGFDDDIIYASRNKIVVDYLKKYFGLDV